MPPRKPNGADDRRVLVDREEYAALLSLRESADTRLVETERTNGRLHDLRVTCEAQARRLSEIDLILQHQERVVGLQRVFIDLLRADHPTVTSLEDLSAFWKGWVASTEELIKRDRGQRDEVRRLEPDLFRSWRIWVRDADRGRQFVVAGTTRAEVDGDRLMLSQAALQDRVIEQYQQKHAALVARVSELESEVEAHRKGRGKP